MLAEITKPEVVTYAVTVFASLILGAYLEAKFGSKVAAAVTAEKAKVATVATDIKKAV